MKKEENYTKWFDGLSDEQRWRLRNDFPEVYECCRNGNFSSCAGILELCVLTNSYYKTRRVNSF